MTTPELPVTSRYHGLEATTLVSPDGRSIPYLRRRFLPSLDRFAAIGAHDVVEGDRLDTIAARYLGDADQYWRLVDASPAMHPAELTQQVGRRLRIPAPEGLPGFDRA